MLSCVAEFAQLPADHACTMGIVAKFRAPRLLDDKAPLRLCAVIDTSGSMGGLKLQLAKDSAEYLLQQLTKQDEFGLVSYDALQVSPELDATVESFCS
jgi:secreted protein with Ig-like and vWFA domain